MTRSRKWCFTLNNPTEDEKETLQSSTCRYLIYGVERGDIQATLHLQGYIVFHNKKSLSQMKNILGRAHWEIAKGNSVQNVNYCSKGGDVFEKGDRPLTKKEKAEKGVQAKKERTKKLLGTSIKDLVEEGEISIFQIPTIAKAQKIFRQNLPKYTPDGLRGQWYFGHPGSGKTSHAYKEYPELYRKPPNEWWGDYEGEKAVLLDDLDRSKAGPLGYFLKVWADRYAIGGGVKSLQPIPLQYDTFIVTSNYTPEQLWPDDDMMQAAIRRRFAFKRFNCLNNPTCPICYPE